MVSAGVLQLAFPSDAVLGRRDAINACDESLFGLGGIYFVVIFIQHGTRENSP